MDFRDQLDMDINAISFQYNFAEPAGDPEDEEDNCQVEELDPDDLTLDELIEFYEDLGTNFDLSAINDISFAEVGVIAALEAIAEYGDQVSLDGMSLTDMLSGIGNVTVVSGDLPDRSPGNATFGQMRGDGEGGWTLTIDTQLLLDVTNNFTTQVASVISTFLHEVGHGYENDNVAPWENGFGDVLTHHDMTRTITALENGLRQILKDNLDPTLTLFDNCEDSND